MPDTISPTFAQIAALIDNIEKAMDDAYLCLHGNCDSPSQQQMLNAIRDIATIKAIINSRGRDHA